MQVPGCQRLQAVAIARSYLADDGLAPRQTLKWGLNALLCGLYLMVFMVWCLCIFGFIQGVFARTDI